MRHLGTEPHWIKISNKVKYPEGVSEKYTQIMEAQVQGFESDFANKLLSGTFEMRNMIIQPRGLRNEKWMCFANSSLQLLFSSPHFVSFAYFMKQNLPLFSPRQLEMVPGWRLFCQFLSDFQFTDSSTSDGALPSLKSLSLTKYAFPTSLKVLDPLFGRFGSQRKPIHQEDAIEFLLDFLSKLHEELMSIMSLGTPKENDGGWKVQTSSRKNVPLTETQGDESPLRKIFSTIIKSETKDKTVTRTVNKESLDVLPLPIRDVNTLDEAIQKFQELEYIEGTISKKATFSSTPKSFIIGLKRFEFDLESLTPIKIDKIIEYPDILTVKSISHPNGIQYQLCGIVVHKGPTPEGGHYVCYVKKIGGSWVLIDDISMTPIPDGGHLGLQAYLLLYNQITSVRNV